MMKQDFVTLSSNHYFLKSLQWLMSVAGARKNFPILIYHRVLPKRDPLQPWEPDAATFQWQMELLAKNFTVLTITDAISKLRDGTLPPRTACVTFDDGYADNATVALPVLREVGIPATFYIATGFLNGGRMWNDSIIEFFRTFTGEKLDLSAEGLGVYDVSTDSVKNAALQKILPRLKYLPPAERQEKVDFIVKQDTLPNNLMMTTDMVQKMHVSGMEIGAHTVTHPILACVSASVAKQEIMDSKSCLENIIGEKVRSFAYPNGRLGQDYLARHAITVQELGFDSAVSTTWGSVNSQSDFWQLPRFTPWDQRPSRFLLRLLAKTYF